MHAASKNSLEIVQILVEAGADVNAVSNDGWSALRLTRNNEIKDYLITNGANTEN
jgi:ankyrin repeat protein